MVPMVTQIQRADYEGDRGALKRKQKPPSDPLDPSWGEPGLLMNLAWSNLKRTTPDLKAAEEDAQATLRKMPSGIRFATFCCRKCEPRKRLHKRPPGG